MVCANIQYKFTKERNMTTAAKKQVQEQEVESELEDEFDEDESITGDDYVFILRSDGSIKGIITPDDDPFDAPKSVKKICKILGLENPNMIGMDVGLLH